MGEHGSSIPGPDVEDQALGARDPMGELADVHLGDATADDLTHGGESTLGR
jgi:hypothetical protein